MRHSEPESTAAADQRKKVALLTATAIVVVLSFVVGYLSTGLVSLLCGTESAEGTYCARISEGAFPIEELGLILVPTVLTVGTGVLSIRRRSARLLLLASLPLSLITVLLPLAVAVVWK